MRRVVTGNDAEGRSGVLFDSDAPGVNPGPIRPGTAMKDIWAMADDKTRIIPGHGDMATKADLKNQIDMLTGAIAAVEKHTKAGDSLQKTLAAKPLKPFSKYAWSFISEDSFTTTLYNGLKQ